MTIVARAQSHITIDDRGIARIDGTRMKVLDIAKGLRSHAPSIQQLMDAFPHLKPAQIHAALAYYYDNQSALDAEIDRESADFEADRKASVPTAGSSKLPHADKPR